MKKVKCINNYRYANALTLNKTYEVIKVDASRLGIYYTIIDNNGNEITLDSSRFINPMEDIKYIEYKIPTNPTHYHTKIQPIEFIEANNLGFHEGNVIKYITRYKDKNGIEDLEKAKTYIEMLIDKLKRENV